MIFGAGGSLGGAAAKAFAKAGAAVFLSGHRAGSIEKVARYIRENKGEAQTHVVDAYDQDAVKTYLEGIAKTAGRIDICYNAVADTSVQGILLTEMALDDFLRPVNSALKTHFITATAAARIMLAQKSGVILSLTATPGGSAYAKVGGFGPGCCALEGFSRDLASEVGPFGIRVVNMRSAGSPDSRVFREAIEKAPEEMEKILRKMCDDTMLKRLPLVQDIANTAVFLASGLAAGITGTTIDVTCGTTDSVNNEEVPAFG